MTIFLLVELVTDQLPKTPSRKAPQNSAPGSSWAPSAARSSAAPCVHNRARLVAGAIGAVIGTWAALRPARLAAAIGGKDRPGAFIEDAVAIGGGLIWILEIVVVGADGKEIRRDHHRRRPGRSVARRPADRGRQRVALVERKLFGGTCVNTGCMPTKTLVASAYAAHLARRAPTTASC